MSPKFAVVSSSMLSDPIINPHHRMDAEFLMAFDDLKILYEEPAKFKDERVVELIALVRKTPMDFARILAGPFTESCEAVRHDMEHPWPAIAIQEETEAGQKAKAVICRIASALIHEKRRILRDQELSLQKERERLKNLCP
jgi:hypothetical protein